MRNERVSAVVLSLLLVLSATTAAVPASAFTPDGPLGTGGTAAGDTSGNDATTTLTETTTTVANEETTTVADTTTVAGDDTTTATTDGTDAGATGDESGATKPVEVSDRKSNPKVSSALLDRIDSDEQDSSADSTGGTEFVQVVVRASPGRSDEAAGLVGSNGGDVQVQHRNLVQARVPEAAVQALASSPAVEFVRQPHRPETNEITSEGLSNVDAGTVHDAGYGGENVTVAVVDTGFNVSNPEISDQLVDWRNFSASDPRRMSNQTGEHGTATAELVADTAPEANVIAVKVSTATELYEAIDWLESNTSTDVVSMSLGWYNVGPLDGTAKMNREINDSVQNGTTWVVSAGNDGYQSHWNDTWSDPDENRWMNFSGSDELMNVTPSGGSGVLDVTISWNDWPDSNEDYDVYLVNSTGHIIYGSEDYQTGSQSPTEYIYKHVNEPVYLGVYNTGANGTADFDVFFRGDAAPEYSTRTRSITIPATGRNVISVGAVDHRDNGLEYFSSRGPTIDGRRKPDVVAPDGVTTSAYSSEFYGTSAAAPHTAGVAALMLDANESLSPEEVKSRLTSSADDLRGDEPNNQTGYGLVDADGAIPSVVNVSGQVDDADGNPSADDFVYFTNDTAEAFPDDYTNATGNFTVSGVRADRPYNVAYYQDVNTSSEYPHDGTPDVYALDRVNVSDSTHLGRYDLPNASLLNVAVVDESGDPVENASVDFVHQNGDATAAFIDVPTDSGGYAVPRATDRRGMEFAGNVTVTVHGPDGDDRFVDQTYTRNLTVTSDENVTVTLEETITVSGQITEADGDTSVDDTVFVPSEPDGKTQGYSMTDSSGNFSASVERIDGSYDVQYYQGNFTKQDGASFLPNDGSPDLYAIDRVDGSNATDLGAVTLPNAHLLNVTVVDESGDPVENATVNATHYNDGADAALVNFETDAQGRLYTGTDPANRSFGFEVLGNLTVEVRPPENSTKFEKVEHTRDLNVTSDENVTVTLTEDTVNFTAKINESDGTAAVDDTVGLKKLPSTPGPRGYTDANGEFTVEVYNGSRYQLEYYQDDLSTDGDLAFPNDGSPDLYALGIYDTSNTTSLSTTLPEAHDLNVTVETVSGEPIQNAEVVFRHHGEGEAIAMHGITTNADGMAEPNGSDGPGFELSGEVDVIVKGPDGTSYKTNRTSLTVDSATTLTMVLRKEIDVTGTVTEADGDPAFDDAVYIPTSGVPGQAFVYTNASGNFSATVRDGLGGYDVQYYQAHFGATNETFMPRDGSPDVYAVTEVSSTNSTDLGNVTLPDANVLNVTVENQSGDPVENASVAISHENEGADAGLSRISTDEWGRMNMSAPNPPGIEVLGNVSVEVEPPENSTRYPNQTHVRNLTVTNDTQVNVTLDGSAPNVTEFNVHNSSQEVHVRVHTDERLSNLTVDLGGDLSGTLTLDDFTVLENDSTPKYDAVVSTGRDGTFDASLVSAEDELGNVGTYDRDDSVFIDLEGPSVDVNLTDLGNRDGVASLNEEVRVEATVVENGSSVVQVTADASELTDDDANVTLDPVSGEENLYAATVMTSNTQGSVANVTVTAYDQNDNSNTRNGTIETDTDVPSVEFFNVSSESGNETNLEVHLDTDEQLAELQVNVTDPDGNVVAVLNLTDFSMTEDYGTYEYLTNVGVSGDGEYTGEVTYLADDAGNDRTNAESATTVVDTTPPTVTDFAGVSNGTDVDLVFNSSEPVANVTVYVNVTGATATHSSPYHVGEFTRTRNFDGSYTYTANVSDGNDEGTVNATMTRAVDDHGNDDVDGERNAVHSWDVREPAIYEMNLTKDGQEVDLLVEADEHLSNVTVDLNGTVDRTLTTEAFDETNPYADVHRYRYNVSNGTDGTFNATLLNATDDFGNDAANGQNDTVVVDTVAPTISNFSVVQDRDNLNVEFDASEDLNESTIAVEVTNESGVTVATLEDWYEDGDGSYFDDYRGIADGVNETWTATLVRAEDNVGNDGADGQNDSAFVDTTPPNITDYGATYSNGTLTVNVSADENLDSIAADIYNASGEHVERVTSFESVGNYTYTRSYSQLDSDVEETYTVNLTVAGDDAGNYVDSEPSTAVWVDTRDPTVDNFHLSNSSGRDVDLTFETDEPLAAIDVNLTGDAGGRLSRADFTETSDSGTYTYTADVSEGSDGTFRAELTHVEDEYGNAPTLLHVSELTVDADGPSVNATLTDATDGNGVVTDGDEVRVEATVVENGSSVADVTANVSALNSSLDTVSLTHEDGDTYSETVTVDGAGNGTRSVTVVATDDSGNANSDDGSIEADNAGPEISDFRVSSLSTETTLDIKFRSNEELSTLKVNLTDGDGNVVDTFTESEMTISEEPNHYTYTVSAGSYNDGEYRATLVSASDAAGNADFGGDVTDNTTVDTTPPTVSTPNLSADAETLDVRVSADEELNASAVAVEVTNETGATVTTLESFTATEEANEYADHYDLASGVNETYTVNVTRAEDDHGLDGADGQNASILVDTVAPTVTLNATFDDENVTVVVESDEPLAESEIVANLSDGSATVATLDAFETVGTHRYAATYTVPEGEETTYTAELLNATDSRGNDGAEGQHDSTFADTREPGVSNVSLANSSKQNLTVSFDANESLGAIEVTISGAENATLTEVNFTEATDNGTATYTASYEASSDGNYTATVERAEDAYGNDGANGQNDSATVDTTSPTVTDATMTDDDGDGAVRDSDEITVVANVSDDVSGIESVTADASDFGAGTVELSDSDGDGTYEATFAVRFSDTSPDGDYPVTVTATDADGNDANADTNALTLDTWAPNVSASLSGTVAENGWYNSSVEVTISASDGGSGINRVVYSIYDRQDWTIYDESYAISGDGNYTSEFTAYDVADNRAQNKTVSFGIDAHAPNTSATLSGTRGENGWYTSDVTMNLSAYDGTSGVNVTEYRVNNGSWTTYDGNLTFSDGNYTVEFKSTDVAGNEETVDSVAFGVDTTDPEVTRFDATFENGTIAGTVEADEPLAANETIAEILDENGALVQEITFSHVANETYETTYEVETGKEGNYTVKLAAVEDEAGNAIWPRTTRNVSVDTAAPNVTKFEFLVNEQDVDLRVNAHEELANLSVSLDGNATGTLTLADFDEAAAGGQYVYTADVSNGSDGTFEAALVNASDAYGNANTSDLNASVVVDTTAPTVHDFNFTTEKQDVDLTLTSNESLAAIEVNLTGDAGDHLSRSNFTETKDDGNYTYTADVSEGTDGTFSASLERVEDEYGNEPNTAALVSTTVDTKAPDVSNFSATNPEDQTIRVTFDADEPLDEMSVAVSGPEEATLTADNFTETSDSGAYAYAATHNVSNDGEYDVTLENATDRQGNDGAEGQHDNVTVDSTAPNVTDHEVTDADDNGIVADGERVSVAVDASDNLTAVENVTADASEFGAGAVVLNDSGDGTYRGNFTVNASDLTDGSVSLSVIPTDTSGNAKEVYVHEFRLDTHAPNTSHSLSDPEGDAGWHTSAVEVNLTASDDGSSVVRTEYRVDDDGSWTTYDGNFTVSGDGSHTVAYRSVDEAGNEESADSVTFDLDTTDPTTNLTTNVSANDAGWYSSDVTVTLDAADATSGVSATYYRKDGAENWTEYNASEGIQFTTDGNHTVEYYSVDVAGNEESRRNETIAIDTQEPTLDGPPGLNRTDEVLPEHAIRVVLNATDDNSGVASVVVDGVAVGQDGEGDVPAAPALGNHTFEVVVTDRAGNEFVVSNESTAYSVGERVEMEQTDNETLSAETNDTSVEEVSIETNNSTSEANLTVGTSKTNPEPDRGNPDGASLYFPQIDTSVSNDEIENATVAVTVQQSRVRQKYVEPDSVQFWVERENESTGWETVDAERVGVDDDNGTYTYRIEAPHFSTYAITGETESAAPYVTEFDTDNESLTPGDVTVTAEYDDDYSGVDPSNVTLEFESEDVTSEATVTDTGLTLTRNLTAGTYNATLTLTDNAGNPLAEPATLTFVVANESDGGSGGGGGGGGGGGDPPEPPVEVELTDVTQTSVTAEVTSARAGAPGKVAPDGGISAGDLTVEKVSLRPKSREATSKFLATATVSETPPGGASAPDVTTLGYLNVSTTYVSDSELESVGVRFAVPTDATAAPENVALYRLDGGSWTNVETSVVGERGGNYVLKAGVPATGVFAVGTTGGDLSVTDAAVGTQRVAPGGTVEVTATVENAGDGAGVATAELAVDGEVVAEKQVTVAAGESKTVTFEVTLDEPGDRALAVDGVSAGSVTVTDEPTTTTPPAEDPDETTETTTGGSGGSGGIPGFGAGTALVALLAGLLVARRRT